MRLSLLAVGILFVLRQLWRMEQWCSSPLGKESSLPTDEIGMTDVAGSHPELIRFGLDTFGDMTVDDNGNPEPAGVVLRHVVAEAKLADELGLDGFNVGEHHRADFAVTAPDIVLAGIATVTKHITLGSGVTVLSSEDPVRVFQRFATIDGLSSGRAEITAGRGSFIESFPLFGYELNDYGVLFEEKLELLVK